MFVLPVGSSRPACIFELGPVPWEIAECNRDSRKIPRALPAPPPALTATYGTLKNLNGGRTFFRTLCRLFCNIRIGFVFRAQIVRNKNFPPLVPRKKNLRVVRNGNGRFPGRRRLREIFTQPPTNCSFPAHV